MGYTRFPGPLPWGEYLFSVAAGVPPAVEPGILPGGPSCGFRREFRVQRCHPGRQAAALYGSQDGFRYNRKPALNTYWGEGEWSAASRSHPRQSLPNDHRLNTDSRFGIGIPSPRGRGSG
jgi:hypothetical protein